MTKIKNGFEKCAVAVLRTCTKTLNVKSGTWASYVERMAND